MNTNKTSESNTITYRIIFVLILIYGISSIIIKDQHSSNIGLTLKGILFVSIAIPIFKLIPIYVTYLVNYIFCVSNTWWIKEIERPRLFFNIGGMIFIFFSIKILEVINPEINTFGYILYIISALLFYLLGMTLVIISWTNFFEKSLIYKVQKKLERKNLLNCIWTNVENKEKLFDDLSFCLKGNQETFNTFLLYDGDSVNILKENQLMWIEKDNVRNSTIEGNKQTLLQFISILFDIYDNKNLIKIANTFFYLEHPMSHRNIISWRDRKIGKMKNFIEKIDSLIKKYGNS